MRERPVLRERAPHRRLQTSRCGRRCRADAWPHRRVGCARAERGSPRAHRRLSWLPNHDQAEKDRSRSCVSPTRRRRQMSPWEQNSSACCRATKGAAVRESQGQRSAIVAPESFWNVRPTRKAGRRLLAGAICAPAIAAMRRRITTSDLVARGHSRHHQGCSRGGGRSNRVLGFLAEIIASRHRAFSGKAIRFSGPAAKISSAGAWCRQRGAPRRLRDATAVKIQDVQSDCRHRLARAPRRSTNEIRQGYLARSRDLAQRFPEGSSKLTLVLRPAMTTRAFDDE